MDATVAAMSEMWRRAATDLEIQVTAPFEFETPDGVVDVAAWVHDFGFPGGTFALTQGGADQIVYERWQSFVKERHSCFVSKLNPDAFLPYDRELLVETLTSWGWFGQSEPPEWYQGQRFS